MLIECSNITKSFQGIGILKDVTFKINDHDKVSIIGVNGAGKTTILKILCGQEEYDSGHLFKNKELTIGYLTQQHTFDVSQTIYQVVLDVFTPLIEMEQQLRHLEQQMANDHSSKVLDEYDRLSHSFSDLGGFSYTSKLTGVLKGLGFLEEEFGNTVATLSGGQKTRLALAKMLLQEPMLLLLDEPTNHLDNSAINFLEGYLKNYPHAVVIVSHDRYFIDQVSNTIIEIEHGKSSVYRCKYQQYSAIKQKQRSVDLKHYINQQKEIKKMQDSIDLLKSYNKEKTVKRAESKEKLLAKMDIIDKPENLPDSISIQFKPKQKSGYDVLKIEEIAVGYDDILFKDVTIDIKSHERVALVGDNGIGKTTLFKTILDQQMLYQGTIKFGSKVDIAYYDQEHTSLSLNKTIFKEISDHYPKMNNTEIRSTLAMFNFRGEDVFKEISMLSGGEKGRVVLTDLLLRQANFLILDEPTNHLDITSKEVLEEALLQFDGTIFFISHDRYFINKVATRVIELTPTKAISYEGNYDTYIANKVPTTNNKETNNNTHVETKQQQAISRKQRNEIKKVEKDISTLEALIDSLNTSLQSEEVINDYTKYNQITDEIKASEMHLEQLLETWEALQE